MARLVIIAGMRKGLMRLGPRERSTSICSERVAIPPMPLAIETPISSRFAAVICNAALRTASLVAATASCTKRSVRRASLRSICWVGSKPFTSAAKRVSKPVASKSVIGPMPLRASLIPCHNSATFCPNGLTAPIPVTTTRRSMRASSKPTLEVLTRARLYHAHRDGIIARFRP